MQFIKPDMCQNIELVLQKCASACLLRRKSDIRLCIVIAGEENKKHHLKTIFFKRLYFCIKPLSLTRTLIGNTVFVLFFSPCR